VCREGPSTSARGAWRWLMEADAPTSRQNGSPGAHLVVIIPALNEEKTIGAVVRQVPRDIEGIARTSVIVIDDGSTDATAQLAREAGATVIRHRSNRGVGASFRTGVSAALDAGADVLVNMDGDGQFDPADIPALIRPILDGAAGMVTCTRFARADLVPDMPKLKLWGNRMMCRLINRICWRARYTDVSCGFRAYSREAAMKLTLFGDFTYTQESFIDLAGKGEHIVEVPLKVRGVRKFGQSRVASNLWRYGVRSLWIIVCAARDVRPLAFFGGMGALLSILGAVCGLIVFGWWLATGRTWPLRSLLLGSGVFLVLGFLLFVLALVADMLGRQRALLERILLRQRMEPGHRTAYEDEPDDRREGPSAESP